MIENSMIGMFVGDALGAQVEFKSKERIRSYFEEKGDFDMFDGGTFNLVKGQVTDDSEMAIALIRSFKEMGENYDSYSELFTALSSYKESSGGGGGGGGSTSCGSSTLIRKSFNLLS